ncbi:hypothetical protein [Parvibaculum sp.]|uniref:hypothetical protein n=1 Tax=Parvibaculum sp. TaxID=2024848 RepID=UPI000CA833CB|nr:hypothetical protein [Parvibaculum sp.]MCW5729061.1 hypothetical protein [Parvibaculum sp.]PKQ07602.1 MAG: hypothetical protein CVT72_02720 [Alphaproteobacteria bacterium HGW-Alphaproteobacteria-11]
MKNEWSAFLKVFAGFFIGLMLLAGGLIFWTNPHRNIPFASLDRPLMEGNQRFIYPSVARDLRFDSAVFGTSSVRFLPPGPLNEEFGGIFAILGMDAATPYEQYRLARLFHEVRLRGDLPVRTVIHGIGRSWCEATAEYDKFTGREFPEWMYDHNPWNDFLYLLNNRVLEVSGRVAAYEAGLRSNTHFDPDGFGDALPPLERYDIKAVRELIYGGEVPLPVEPVDPPVDVLPAERASWVFGAHELMPALLALSPHRTTVILMFVPFHEYFLPRPGSHEALVLDECKARIVAMAAARPNTLVVDFMRSSEINREDTNYWDPVHYGHETAEVLVRIVARAVRREGDDSANVTILHNGLVRAEIGDKLFLPPKGIGQE